MKNNKTKLKIIISILTIVIICFVAIYFLGNNQNGNSDYTEIDTTSTKLDVQYDNQELTGEWLEYVAKITLDDSKVTIEGNGVTNNENAITIKSAGTYYITGNLTDGNILIDANKNDDVQLVLDNCSIKSSNTAPINGIVSKDELKIINSNIEINSEDDGIRGKDYVAINKANIKVDSKGDGIKSTNDLDTALGYVEIEEATIVVDAEADGIQAETILNISSNSKIDITTSGEIVSSNKDMEFGGPVGSMEGGFRKGFGGFAGELPKQKQNTTSSNLENSQSSKGLKAGTEITIESGNIEINSTDDSIHSNGIIVINDGEIKTSSEDDGIHADTNIAINGGNIEISKSYEGIESSYVEINAGMILITSSDDSINIAGGNDSSAMGDRMGQNNFSMVGDSNQKLIINGGCITANAAGDGLDSNGAIYINGGSVVVVGPTSSGNGALDYTTECVITGGNVIIYGSTGMWQNPSSNSTQYCLTFGTSGSSGDEVVLKDSNGNEIVSFETYKSYGTVAISNAKIEKGETYTLYINGTSTGSLTASSTVTSNVSANGMGGGMQEGMQPEGKGKR